MTCTVVAAAVVTGVVALTAVAVSGCQGGIEAAGLDGPGVDAAIAPDAHTMDAVDAQMLAEAGQMMRFTKIDRTAYASALGTFDINLFISQDARDYRQIHPETTGSNVIIPVGTLIARQVLDANGQLSKVTLMGKGPAGYDPTLGDWWFGELDPSGVPLTDSTGIQLGRLTACHGCHVPRAQDDYLFGVPQQDQ